MRDFAFLVNVVKMKSLLVVVNVVKMMSLLIVANVMNMMGLMTVLLNRPLPPTRYMQDQICEQLPARQS